MNLESIANIIIIITYSMLIIFFCIPFGLVIYGSIVSKLNEKKYKISIIKIILSDDFDTETDKIESIINTYTNYKTKSDFSYLNFDEINSRLIQDLRDDTYKKYYKNPDIIEQNKIIDFTRLNKKIKDKFQFKDERVEQMLLLVNQSLLSPENKTELCESIRSFVGSVFSFCDGRIFEKEQELSKKNFEIDKLTKKKWYTRISWIVGLLGFISSIITIISFLR